MRYLIRRKRLISKLATSVISARDRSSFSNFAALSSLPSFDERYGNPARKQPSLPNGGSISLFSGGRASTASSTFGSSSKNGLKLYNTAVLAPRSTEEPEVDSVLDGVDVLSDHHVEARTSSHFFASTTPPQLEEKEEPVVSDMLVDSHGRRHNYLRISLTERCNLRCKYCMPAEGVQLTPTSELLARDEILRLAGLFAAGGVSKIRLTGGEPTVRSDIEDICTELSALPGVKTLAMTTNGLVLARKLPRLKAAGLHSLNISLDTMVPAKFELMTRRKGHDKVLQSIDKALELGFSPVKVNIVIMRGLNDDEIGDFVELTRTKPVNVRFIEFMPFDGNVWSSKKLVSYAEMLASVRKMYPSLRRLSDHHTEVAKNFQVDDFEGTVSFITSMTEHFCGGCNRLRLMADGNFKVCLFGPAEVSLRDAIRSGLDDSRLGGIINDAVKRKKFAHAGMFDLAKTQNRPMIHIGG